MVALTSLAYELTKIRLNFRKQFVSKIKFSKKCHKASLLIQLTVKIKFWWVRILKVRQNRNVFFKPTILPKNKRTNSGGILCLTARWQIVFDKNFSFIFWKSSVIASEIYWPLVVFWQKSTFYRLCSKSEVMLVFLLHILGDWTCRQFSLLF